MSIKQDLIQAAIDGGVTFSDFLAEWAKKNTEDDNAYIARARDEETEDGVLEIDTNTICSGPEDGSGSYVLAWVWIDGPPR